MKTTHHSSLITPSFAIGIPTLNRWDLLKPSLQKYLTDFPNTDILILDNGKQDKDIDHDRLGYIIPAESKGVAASWNELCQEIFRIGHTHAMILNDDIYLGKKEATIKKLIADSPRVLLTTMKDFSAFLLPKTTFDLVGPFDQHLKCYYEDSDYIYRMKLAGYKPLRTSGLSPEIYRENSTGEKELRVHKWALQSKQYYIKKWGGTPGQEKFSKPFNGISF